jgi:circadian clock protein KaiC
MGVESPVDLSYLADTVLLLRYFEHAGRVRKSIAAVKTRGGGHEDSIREFQIAPQGIRVGAPLVEFQGVLGGAPTYIGAGRLLAGDAAGRPEGAAPPSAASGGSAAAARLNVDGGDRGAR